MTTATVTGPLLADDLTPLAHRPVRVHLAGGSHYAGGELVLDLSAVTDNAGQFSFVLPINTAELAGTWWEVTTPGLPAWTISLPSAGTWHVGDPAIQTVGVASTPAAASTSYVDTQVGLANARIDALAAIPALPGIAALSGFFDLAGQSRVMFRATSTGSAQNPIVALRAGRVMGLSVSGTAARTAGSATFTALINGASAGVTTVIDASNPQYSHTAGGNTFAAGDRLAVSHVDAGFTPSTNYEATLWVQYT